MFTQTEGTDMTEHDQTDEPEEEIPATTTTRRGRSVKMPLRFMD